MIPYKGIFSVLVSVSVTLLILSCNGSKKSENALTEGVIEYEATVVDESHPMAGLAPKTATVKFKENRFQLEMSTMGMFNTTFISSPAKKTLAQMVKFMNIKDVCIQTGNDLVKENQGYELRFEKTKDTKKIAGYKCHRLKAIMVKDPHVFFDVYYTTELGSDSINFLSPYREVKGMLMQYRLKKMDLEMYFTATIVKKEEVKNDIFDIPSDYRIVTCDEMKELFSSILN